MRIERFKNIIKYIFCGIPHPQVAGAGGHSDLPGPL